MNNRQVPKAEMIEALNELDLAARSTPSAGGPEVPYYQVEINQRKPLPFTRKSAAITQIKNDALAVSNLITVPVTVPKAFQEAKKYLAASATPTALAALRGERQAPPLLGTLAEGLETPTKTVVPTVSTRPGGKVYDHFIDPPVAVGMMSGATVGLSVNAKNRTTVKGSARAWRVPPPTFASVEAERSHSIATRLVLADPIAPNRNSTVIGAFSVPPTLIAHAAPALVARRGAANADHLTDFTQALSAKQRGAKGGAGATLTPGQTVVLKMPNARADAALEGKRPQLRVTGEPARVVLLGHGGQLLADRLVGSARAGGADPAANLEIVRGVERIVAIGQSRAAAGNDTGLSGWHAGMQMPYAGWSTAIAPGCVVRSTSDTLRQHRERLDAGWVTGAELSQGVSTVTTTFAEGVKTVVIVLDDPASFGDPVSGRQLLLGLDGAERALAATGKERPPVLLAMENRSVLAYDIQPERGRPVVVTIASESGWSLVGVMASPELDATGAIALISARGLDAALRPLAPTVSGVTGTSQLEWLGPTRTPQERHHAKALASGRPPTDAIRSAVAPAATESKTSKAAKVSQSSKAAKVSKSSEAAKASQSSKAAKASKSSKADRTLKAAKKGAKKGGRR
jgi:hypothetical protein